MTNNVDNYDARNLTKVNSSKGGRNRTKESNNKTNFKNIQGDSA